MVVIVEIEAVHGVNLACEGSSDAVLESVVPREGDFSGHAEDGEAVGPN